MTTTTEREPRVTLGDLLKRARLDAGMEQAELAALVGCGRSSVGHWERDETVPPFDVVRRIVHVTGATWLLTEPFKNEVRTRSRWSDLSADGSDICAGRVLADAAA